MNRYICFVAITASVLLYGGEDVDCLKFNTTNLEIRQGSGSLQTSQKKEAAKEQSSQQAEPISWISMCRKKDSAGNVRVCLMLEQDETIYRQNNIECKKTEKGALECSAGDGRFKIDESGFLSIGKSGLPFDRIGKRKIDHAAARLFSKGDASSVRHESKATQCPDISEKDWEVSQSEMEMKASAKYYICCSMREEGDDTMKGCVVSPAVCGGKKPFVYGVFSSEKEARSAFKRNKR